MRIVPFTFIQLLTLALGASRIDVPFLDKIAYPLLRMRVGGQILDIKVDTGSADTWVMKNTLCDSIAYHQNIYQRTDEWGCYEPHQAASVDADLNITYLDGSVIEGSFYIDSFTLNNNTVVQNVQFAVADSAKEMATGIMGLADPSCETVDRRYSNFVPTMYQQGLMDRNAFSMHIDPKTSQGILSFGSEDPSKYVGPMQLLDVLPAEDGVHKMWDVFAQIQYGDVNVFDRVHIDSGNTMIRLPKAIEDQLIKDYNMTYSEHYGSYFYECTDDEPPVKIRFQDLSINLQYWSVPYDQGQCRLMVQKSVAGKPGSLGLPILRNVYVNFDLEQGKIGFAPLPWANYSFENHVF